MCAKSNIFISMLNTNLNNKNKVNLGIIELDLEKKSDLKIRTALSNFVKKDITYKNKFLQSRYKTAFDGYSYIGQKDSLNQYDSDLLHSFVLSEFQNVEHFPKEFHSFLKEDWNTVISTIKAIEIQRIQKLNNPILLQLYEEDLMGYMMSCNYYPKPTICTSDIKNKIRLSAHKDASLFTTFPFGVDKGLSIYNADKSVKEVNKKEKMILFTGYFIEFVSNNKIKALIHQVNLPEDLNSERFSFAVFSIPKPDAAFLVDGKKINGKDYYNAYLSLF